MIKLRYAILGSIIPMFVIFHYSNNIIDNLGAERYFIQHLKTSVPSRYYDKEQLMFNELKRHYPDLQIGTYHHHAGSLHLYEMHYDMAAQILEGDSYSENYNHSSGIFTLKPNITLEYIQKNELYLPSKDMTKEEIGEYAKTVSKSLFI